MRAIYFDGQSSRANEVQIDDTGDGLKISSADGSERINVFWQKDLIETESFSTGNKVLLSYGDFPFQRLELTGEGADSFMRDVLQHESLIKQYQFGIRIWSSNYFWNNWLARS